MVPKITELTEQKKQDEIMLKISPGFKNYHKNL